MTEQELTDTISTNTAAGMVLANYMKSISGTAISQQEMQRLMAIVQAGNGFSNPEAMLTAIKQFERELETQAKEQIQTASSKGYGHSAATGYERMYGSTKSPLSTDSSFRRTKASSPAKTTPGPKPKTTKKLSADEFLY